MNTNKEKFLNLVDGESSARRDAQKRTENRKSLKVCRNIALRILERLDELNWEKKEFAERMNVSPQQVSKWVSGKHEVKSSTLQKFEDVLGIPFLVKLKPKKNKGSASKRTGIVEVKVVSRQQEKLAIKEASESKYCIENKLYSYTNDKVSFVSDYVYYD